MVVDPLHDVVMVKRTMKLKLHFKIRFIAILPQYTAKQTGI